MTPPLGKTTTRRRRELEEEYGADPMATIKSNTTYSGSDTRSEHLPLMLLPHCCCWPSEYVGRVDRPRYRRGE
jgi:hypothetical protein